MPVWPWCRCGGGCPQVAAGALGQLHIFSRRPAGSILKAATLCSLSCHCPTWVWVPRHSGFPLVEVGELFHSECQRWVSAILPAQDSGPGVPRFLSQIIDSPSIPRNIFPASPLPRVGLRFFVPCGRNRGAPWKLPPLTVFHFLISHVFVLKRVLFFYE